MNLSKPTDRRLIHQQDCYSDRPWYYATVQRTAVRWCGGGDVITPALTIFPGSHHGRERSPPLSAVVLLRTESFPLSAGTAPVSHPPFQRAGAPARTAAALHAPAISVASPPPPVGKSMTGPTAAARARIIYYGPFLWPRPVTRYVFIRAKTRVSIILGPNT